MKIKCRLYKPGMRLRYAHAKLDGHYIEAEKTSRLRVFNSGETDITAKVRENDWFQKLAKNLQFGEKVAGELYVPGAPSTDVPTRLANEGELSFSCFAAFNLSPLLPLPSVKRYCSDLLQVPFAPFHIVPHEDCSAFIEQNPMPEIGEGWVFKDGNLENWTKYKPVNTVDAIISGYTYGKGKYEGQIGSVIVSVFDVNGRFIEIANVNSGISDDIRLMFTQAQNEWLGRVIEVSYQLAYPGGRLRHPVFIRYRPDKLAKECTMDQIIEVNL
jgi:hypothetical protein